VSDFVFARCKLGVLISAGAATCLSTSPSIFTTEVGQTINAVTETRIAPAPAWLFAAEVREDTFIRLLTAFERAVPIPAVRPAGRRPCTKVQIFIEQL
jgi:hypothetical protein